jgi:hypothetical protein
MVDGRPINGQSLKRRQGGWKMAKAIAGIMAMFLTVGSLGPVLAGDWTAHGFSYKPSLGARGTVEKGRFDSGQDRVDTRLSKEIWVGDPNYGTTIQGALTAIGSNQAILRVPAGSHSISGNLIVPRNVTLKVEGGATLAVPPGIVLTLNGALEAGLYQIFSCTGTGKVVFGPGSVKEVLPQWFGAKGDGVTDDTAAIQSAFDSLPTVTTTGWRVRFVKGTYYVTSAINLPGEVIDYSNPAALATVHITGDGAVLSTDQAISIFKRWPSNDTTQPNRLTSTGYVIEGLTFTGSSLRSQVGLDLACTYTARIVNCRFNFLGRGLRLTYAMMAEVVNCMANQCAVSGFNASDGYGVWASDHTWGSPNVIYRSCRAFTAAATNVAIAGMSRANPCVVTWTGHGLASGDIVFIDGITQAGWTALNHRRFQITKIDNDSFSLKVMNGTDGGAPLNTSGYAANYVPASDPGVIQAAVFGWESQGETFDNCICEGGNCTDNIFLYTTQIRSLTAKNLYQENTPYGSVLYLNYQGGKITLDGFGSIYAAVIIDAYDVAANIFGTVDARNYTNGGTGKIRLPQDNGDSLILWSFKYGNAYGYGSEEIMSPSYWYGGVQPWRVSNTLTKGFPSFRGRSIELYGGQGTFVREEPNIGAIYGSGYEGLKSQANADGGGGVGAYDVTNAQSIMIRQKTSEITITASGTATQDLAGFIPAGVMVVGFTARITATIGGATSLSVGETGSANLWINAMGVSAASVGTLTKATAAAPKIYAAATTVRLTGNGGNFNGTGKVRLTVHYLTLEAPGS